MTTKRRVKEMVSEAYLAERSETFTLPDGTVLSKGDELKVRGQSGNWRFSYAYKNEPILYGGDLGYGHLRSFRVERLYIPKKKTKRNLSESHRQMLRERAEKMRQAKRSVAA
jgi:hypothetical protein